MDEIVEKIYANQDILNKICFSFCSEKADREDLFQEIVYRVLRAHQTFNKKSLFSTWLYRIALNTAITYSKKKKPFLFEDRIHPVIEESTGDQDRNEDIVVLYKAIGKLNKIERAIILLYLDEYSYDEIAEITGFTAKNISVKIHRIKKKLHELYIQLTD